MAIVFSKSVLVIVVILFTGIFFFMNMKLIKSLSLTKSKVLISSLILAEVALLFGSRILIPFILRYFIDTKTFIYNIADLILFIVIIYFMFRIDEIFKGYIVDRDIRSLSQASIK